MSKLPDYIGVWYRPKSFTKMDIGQFRMYIEKSEEKEGQTKIAGSIKDKDGDSTFEGVLTEETIFFVKKYDGDTTPIVYEGKIAGEIYKGTFNVENRKLILAIDEFTEVKLDRPDGEFVLEKLQ